METAVPVLHTERLTLRGHRLEDYEDCCAMWGDPIVTQHIGGKPSTRQQTWSRILSYAGHWQLLGFGYWVIEDAEKRRFVGEVGFADFKRDIAPSMQGVPELGYALSPAFHGKGYATEAIQAAIDWMDRNLKAARTVCLIDPGNAASIHVAQKCGYNIFERATFNGGPALFLERMRHP